MFGTRRMWLALLTTGLCAVAGCSCEASTGDGDEDGSVDPMTDGSTVVPGSCTSSADCTGGRVCHPFAMSCVAPGPTCMASGECGEGTYCDPTVGACLPGTPGSPCETADNCTDQCMAGVCSCTGLAHEQQIEGGPLDVYLILDRTGSMGRDCSYTHGDAPPVNSKACSATYALSDYLIDVSPEVDTRLAFNFMSQPDDCDGSAYVPPLIGLTQLPVLESHMLIQEISDETFGGGLGTHIEGALRGLALYTAANETPGREMIGVLMTDGDPNGCEENIGDLATIIGNHLDATGIRTFIIGMEGATERNLEQLAIAGGAEAHDNYCGGIGPPCHYWNVGDGSGASIADALTDIIAMAVPLPCQFSVADLTPPPGEALDFSKVNVTVTEAGTTTTVGQVPSEAACPSEPAWYYDDPAAPTEIHLCPSTCSLVTDAGDGARLDVVVGCMDTVTLI